MAVCETTNTLETWLAARRSMIGASESPAIVGCGYSDESPWTVWAKKTGLIDDTPDSELLWYGRKMQPITLERFTIETGIQVQDLGEFTIQRHQELPWLGCTLDGMGEDPAGLAVVEAKNIGHYGLEEWNAPEPPLRVQVQIQHQLAVTGLSVGYAVATVGGNKLRFRRIERNERFIGILIERLKAFWQCVETNTPPEVDGSAATARVLQLLHPDDSGETVSLPPEAAQWDADLKGAKAKVKELEELIRDRENRIKAELGSHTFGLLPDGGKFSFKTTERDGYEVKPTKYRTLRRLK